MASGERITGPSKQAETIPQTIKDSNLQFLHLARKLIDCEDSLPDRLKVERSPFSFKNPPEFAHFRDEESDGQVMIADINLSGIFGEEGSTRIMVFDTPESNAITLGRLSHNKKGKLSFQLPRFHTGVPAQKDLRLAIYQALQFEGLRKLISNPGEVGETYIVNFAREGHLSRIDESIYSLYGLNTPSTLVHVSHVEDKSPENPFTRLARLERMNLEGFDAEKLKTLILSDPVASGIQQAVVLQEILRIAREKSPNGSQPERVLIVSPLLTYFGASCVASAAAKEKVSCTFITCGTILGCNPPDYYFSPVKEHKNLTPNPELAKLVQKANGDVAGAACARCNWTASFLAPEYALEYSEMELGKYGSNNEYLIASADGVTKEIFEKKLQSHLIPYSTFLEADSKGSTFIP